jgi:hypothetical protein
MRHELHHLLSGLLDETLEPHQQERLAELLHEHAEARDLYLAYFGLHADLALSADKGDSLPVTSFGISGLLRDAAQSMPAASLEVGRGSQRASARRRRAKLMLWGGVGLAAALLLALTLPWRRAQHNPPLFVPPEASDNTVAVLLQAGGAQWDETGLPTRSGGPLAPGRLRLNSGSAQIEFYSGATVILEGPAEFELLSPMEAYCASGKLRAIVPVQAQGFKIGSPRLNLVDQGTEFGLQVSEGQKTEVHVFRGKVELHQTGSTEPAVCPKELCTGQALRLDGAAVAREIQTDPAAFPTAEKLAASMAAEVLRRQRGWAAASDAIRHDPSLLVYYTFQPEQSWSRTLRDQSANGGQSHDGAIVGCSWMAGRWAGKQGLQFKRVSDRVRFNVPGSFDAITLAAWVRVDALPNPNNSLMMADGWPEGAVHWQIGDNGTIILGVRGPAQTRNAHYHAPDGLTSARLGHWVHLTVVYDRPGTRVTHYVDGRAVSQEPILIDVPVRIGNAEIGNWNGPSKSRQPIRFLTGCMDEFMLFGRALDDKEVERLFKQGQPPG